MCFFKKLDQEINIWQLIFVLLYFLLGQVRWKWQNGEAVMYEIEDYLKRC